MLDYVYRVSSTKVHTSLNFLVATTLTHNATIHSRYGLESVQVARDTVKLQGQASTMHTKFDHPPMLTSSTLTPDSVAVAQNGTSGFGAPAMVHLASQEGLGFCRACFNASPSFHIISRPPLADACQRLGSHITAATSCQKGLQSQSHDEM